MTPEDVSWEAAKRGFVSPTSAERECDASGKEAVRDGLGSPARETDERTRLFNLGYKRGQSQERQRTDVMALNDQLISVRELMRGLGKVLARFESGEQHRALVTKNGKIVAALVPISRGEDKSDG